VEFLAKSLRKNLDKVPEQADLWVALVFLYLEIFEKRYLIYTF